MRRFYYLKPDLQHAFTSVFTFIAAVEIILFGVIIFISESFFYHIPKDIQIYYRFGYVLFSVMFFSLFNFWFGARLSHKIAGPLVQIQRVLDSAIKGNYKVRVHLRSGDLLHEMEEKLNSLLENLENSHTIFFYGDQRNETEADKKEKFFDKQEIG